MVLTHNFHVKKGARKSLGLKGRPSKNFRDEFFFSGPLISVCGRPLIQFGPSPNSEVLPIMQ